MRLTDMLHALIDILELVKVCANVSSTRKHSKNFFFGGGTMRLMPLRQELASPDPLGQGWRMFLVRLPSPVKGPSAGFSARF